MKISERIISMHEAKKINGAKMIADMEKAIKDNDKKGLLKFMAMDKKDFFSKNNLELLVDDGVISADEKNKLGKLSIEVAQALR